MWTWSGQKKIFNFTVRLELKCGGDEFQGEEHSAVRRNGESCDQTAAEPEQQKKRSQQKQLGYAAEETHLLPV